MPLDRKPILEEAINLYYRFHKANYGFPRAKDAPVVTSHIYYCVIGKHNSACWAYNCNGVIIYFFIFVSFMPLNRSLIPEDKGQCLLDTCALRQTHTLSVDYG